MQQALNYIMKSATIVGPMALSAYLHACFEQVVGSAEIVAVLCWWRCQLHVAVGASIRDQRMPGSLTHRNKVRILAHDHIGLRSSVRGTVASRWFCLVIGLAVPTVVAGHAESATAHADRFESSR